MKKYMALSLLFSAGFAILPMASRAQDSDAVSPVDEEADTSSPSRSTDVQNYSIRDGDTMWDICKIVLDNPWYWPKLWSLNQYILNPNLIFPGQKLAFSPGTDTTFPRMEVVDGDAQDMSESMWNEDETDPNPRKAPPSINDTNFIVENSAQRNSADTLSVKLRPISFLTPKELNTVGKVVHSGEPKMNLVFGDKVYLQFYSKRNVKLGDKFEVIEKVKSVFDPDRETKRIGWMIHKKVEVTVNHISNEKNWKKRIIEATISDGDDYALRGDEIIPYEADIISVVPHFTEKEIFGKIVEADHEQFLISNNDFVFLNIGSKDGLQPGLQLYVVRTGDGLLPEEGDNLPDVPVAKIMIVIAHEKTATAYVTTLDRSLSVGDRVRSKIE